MRTKLLIPAALTCAISASAMAAPLASQTVTTQFTAVDSTMHTLTLATKVPSFSIDTPPAPGTVLATITVSDVTPFDGYAAGVELPGRDLANPCKGQLTGPNGSIIPIQLPGTSINGESICVFATPGSPFQLQHSLDIKMGNSGVPTSDGVHLGTIYSKIYS